MKKIIKKIIMLCMVLFLTTGCLKQTVSMEVKSNKKVNLEVIYALGMDASEETEDEQEEAECAEGEFCLDNDEMSMDIKKEDYEELLKYGYKVEEYKEEKNDLLYSGVKITKTFDSIDDISDDKNKVEFDFSTFFEQEDSYKTDPVIFYKEGDVYIADFIFNFASGEEETDLESLMEKEEYKKLLDAMDLKYTITLPQEPKSHNATSVSKDGKTLTWELEYGKKNEVNFEFSLGTNPMWYFIIIGGIVVAVLLIGGIVVSITNNKKYATMLDQQMKGIVPDNNVVTPPMFDNQPVAQPQQMPQQPMEQQLMQQPVMEQPMMQQPMQPQQMPQQQVMQQQPMVDNQSFGVQNNNFPN